MTEINQSGTLIAVEAWNITDTRTGDKTSYVQAISPSTMNVSNDRGRASGTRANPINLQIDGHLPEADLLPDNFPRHIKKMTVVSEDTGRDGIISKKVSNIAFGEVLK